jgi:hypothetical protein
MRRYAWLLFLLCAPVLLGDRVGSAQQPQAVDACEPVVRRDTPAVERAREAKKRFMRENGVPERYLHLLDNYHCIQCIMTAPDTVHVTVVWKDEYAPRLTNGSVDHVTTVRMLPQIERQLRDDLSSGRVESFHVWISEKRCRCCPDDEDKQPEDYDDWDDDIGANTDQVDSFDDPSDLPPLPDDLKNAPTGWTPPPPIENFPRPRGRYMHVMCPKCQPLADQWNFQARVMDMLQEQKNSLLRSISVMRNAIGNRNNEINDLEYQQRFNNSRTFDRMKAIEELKQLNESHQSQIEKAERDIQAVEASMAEVQKKLDDLMQLVIKCENDCKSTTSQTPTATGPATISLNPKKPDLRYTELPPSLPSLSMPPVPVNSTANVTTPDPPPASTGSTPPPLADAPPEPVADWRNADPDLKAACEKCEPKAKALRDLNQHLSSLHTRVQQIRAQRSLLQDALATGKGNPQDIQGQLNQLSQNEATALSEYTTTIGNIARAERELEECNRSCGPATANQQPPSQPGDVSSFTPPVYGPARPANVCTGAACSDTWRTCSADNSCLPINEDCGVVGTPNCPFADPPGVQTLDLTNPNLWGPAMTITITVTIDQYKYTHPTPTNSSTTQAAIVFPAMQPESIRSWFNPLGLLATRVRDQVDRWRGSVGPRPFITTRALEMMDRYSNAQAAGLPQGVHMLLTDRGGSTGKTLGLQLLNLSGKPVRLSSIPFAIEPLDRKASQAAQQAFAKLAKVMPQQIDLSAYCLEFLKAPPSANTIYRLAPKAIQDKFAPISKVLRSAYRIEHAGLLNPDSNPAAYTDSIKQWAVWAVEQNYNESRFTDAFVGHTRKNVEGAGQKWSKDAEAVIRKISPNRWQDITKILRGAGLPLPQ